jgi:hypothetical protein
MLRHATPRGRGLLLRVEFERLLLEPKTVERVPSALRQQDHPPEGGAALDVGVRGGGLGERELLVDDDPQRSPVVSEKPSRWLMQLRGNSS